MRSVAKVAVCAVLGCALGCNAGEDPLDLAPFAASEALDTAGLGGPVQVVRDEFGIAHLWARDSADLAFAQGYVTAHDRLPQMDILRRIGAGTLAELFGAFDPGAIQSDLAMRIHRMKALAEAADAQLRASTRPSERALVIWLDRFAAGVNAYHRDLLAGRYRLDPAVRLSFDPAQFVPWSAVDSLVLARFQAFSLSFTAANEIALTEIYQRAFVTFDRAGPGAQPEFSSRRGAAVDLIRLAPVGRVATLAPSPRRLPAATGDGQGGAALAAGAESGGLLVPRPLLTSARSALLPRLDGLVELLRAGSNNFAIAPQLGAGKVLLAGDQHLALPNPSLFYPIHLISPGDINAIGVTFPGIPGILLGHNGRIAWSATLSRYDVNDVYLETIAPCRGQSGDCVQWKGQEVAIERRSEEIRIGALGAITDRITVVYETVPHHGPIIPEIAGRDIVPRRGSSALSVRYTGYSVTNELVALYNLARAATVPDGFEALRDFSFGGQNWVIIDNQGNMGWTTIVDVPLRSPGSYTWSPDRNPLGNAPFFVLPGDGSSEWEGLLDRSDLPQALNPATGYLVTANSDPTGATFDGLPFDEVPAPGRPLYFGALYLPGLRSARITELIEGKSGGRGITLADLATIQHDSNSTVGGSMQANLRPVLAKLADRTLPRTPDLDRWLRELPNELRQKLIGAAQYLARWTLATPAALNDDGSEQNVGDRELSDSVATTIFNVWVHFFLGRAIGDEFEAMGLDAYNVVEETSVRLLVALLQPDPAPPLASGNLPATGQPVLCDDMRTKGMVESCDLIVLQALAQAVTWLESRDAFATADPRAWRWGALHTLTLRPFVPNPELNLPAPARNNHKGDVNKSAPWNGGFPRPGDNFVINRADCGYNDRDFSHDQDGPAQRFLAEAEPGGTIRAKLALPGGTVYDRSSPHYSNLLIDYFLPHRHFALPYTRDEIDRAARPVWSLIRP